MTHPSARDVLDLLSAGIYAAPSGAVVSIADALHTAVAGTRAIPPEQLAALALTADDDAPPPRRP